MSQNHAPQPEPEASTNEIEWLTTKEAATFLKVSPRTVLKMVHRNELVASYIGRSLRILKSSIDAFMENHRAT